MDNPWKIVDLRHQKNGKIKIMSGCVDIANVLIRDVDDPMRNAQIIAEAPLLRARIDRLEKLVQRLLDEDPNEQIAESGVTVLCAWRNDARRALEEK
jgi:hypothetical protein